MTVVRINTRHFEKCHALVPLVPRPPHRYDDDDNWSEYIAFLERGDPARLATRTTPLHCGRQ